MIDKQIDYWTHMLDEAFGSTESIKEYPSNIKDNILNDTYYPHVFNDEYGEFSHGDEGFITPYGTIMHCGGENHHNIIKDILDDSYVESLSERISNRSLANIKSNSDDSVLIADALDHGLVRFSADDNITEFGKATTKDALDLLYDFVDYVMEQEKQIEADANGTFKWHSTFGEGLDSKGNIIYSDNAVVYTSLNEFSKRFINDVKRNVDIK